MSSGSKSSDGIRENHRHNELLAWATAQIDHLTSGDLARQQVCDMLDWMAYFTREHFGFQQRMLSECSKQRDYLARRAAVHGEFRRQLAQLCLDSTRGDASVAARLRSLAHEILRDAQLQQDAFSELVRDGVAASRLRSDPTRKPLAAEAAQAFASRVAGTTH